MYKKNCDRIDIVRKTSYSTHRSQNQMGVHGKYTLPVWFKCFQFFLDVF